VLHALYGSIHIVGTGDNHNRNFRVVSGYHRKQLFSGYMRHSQVQQHDFDLLAGKQRHDIATVVTANEVVHIGRTQCHFKAGYRLGFIIHHHDGKMRIG
jgi:hypothetical protein